MLQGCIFWPQDQAQRFRDAGLWSGQTLWDMMAATIARSPAKTAVVAGDTRLSYRDLDEQTAVLGVALLAWRREAR